MRKRKPIIAILILLVVVPLSLALFGLVYNNQTFVVFALTISLIFLTFLLLVSSSRLEEHLIRLADIYKISIGTNTTLEVNFPDSCFDTNELGKSLELFKKNRSHYIDYWQDKQNKRFFIRYLATTEKELRQLVLKNTKDDCKDRVMQELMIYENL
ncbi:MAG: hypothetical protein ACYCP1_02895 [Thermoplasmataceae archaeon]